MGSIWKEEKEEGQKWEKEKKRVRIKRGEKEALEER